MRGFVRFINRLPFAGKMSIRPLVFLLYSSTTRGRQWASYAGLIILLAVFVVGHSFQARDGMAAAMAGPVSVKIVGGLYAVANISVVIAQVYLAGRVTLFIRRGLTPRRKKAYRGFSLTSVIIMIAVTLGGQIVFLSVCTPYVS